jgi:hypothetical protein
MESTNSNLTKTTLGGWPIHEKPSNTLRVPHSCSLIA